LKVLDERLVARLNNADLRKLLDPDLARLLQVENPLLQPVQRLVRVLVGLRRKQGITALARLLGGTFEFGQPAPAEFFGKGLAGRDVSSSPVIADLVSSCRSSSSAKIAAQRLLVAVELKGDAVDLARQRHRTAR